MMSLLTDKNRYQSSTYVAGKIMSSSRSNNSSKVIVFFQIVVTAILGRSAVTANLGGSAVTAILRESAVTALLADRVRMVKKGRSSSNKYN